MTRKNADYWAGYDAEAARNGRTPSVADLARQVTQALGRDNARKQRIAARSPHIFAAMDAEEFGRASSVELAARELRELGIDIGDDDDPEKMLDMHHAGRQWARARDRGVHGVAVKSSVMEGLDASDDSFMDQYLEG